MQARVLLYILQNTTCHFQIHILRNSGYSNCAIMLCQISHKHPTFFHRSSDPPPPLGVTLAEGSVIRLQLSIHIPNGPDAGQNS